MVTLIANTKYLIEDIEMKFIKTVKNGEVAIFNMDGIEIRFGLEELLDLKIEKREWSHE